MKPNIGDRNLKPTGVGNLFLLGDRHGRRENPKPEAPITVTIDY